MKFEKERSCGKLYQKTSGIEKHRFLKNRLFACGNGKTAWKLAYTSRCITQISEDPCIAYEQALMEKPRYMLKLWLNMKKLGQEFELYI